MKEQNQLTTQAAYKPTLRSTRTLMCEKTNRIIENSRVLKMGCLDSKVK
jgi:hypothetical protein